MERRYGNYQNLREFIHFRDNYRCKQCGRIDDYHKFHVDHIIPIDEGGRSIPENLQLLCPSCNLHKEKH
jgi:5-methylcytosine-specific restriction endonuclease McrA